MQIGYVRVSKNEQNLDLQVEALKKAGCEQIFKEKISGAEKERPQYLKMIEGLRKGDTVTVWRIDRLGRTTLELIKLMVEFREKGIEFKSIVEGIDTSTSMGRIWYMLSSIFAENEREIIRERTKAGLASAKARGRVGGRPKGLTEDAKKLAATAATLYNTTNLSTAEICKMLNIGSKTTLYRYLRHAGVEVNGWVKNPNVKIENVKV
ncbi:recombinase family protein [Desertivirga arenae]|uniref:recombinase family protein n=1 Tax=Desertivirga arenae TaxID=2810309 RepID=UPI001A972E88|nr:recombinase family protein [Pedobacter sp. SYSU D00823]